MSEVTMVEQVLDRMVEQVLDSLVRRHLDALHAHGLGVPYARASERTRRVLRDQLRGHAEAAVAAAYDREALVEVLTYHWRDGLQGCRCGWARLGASWPEHVAEAYEAALRGRG